MATNNRDVKMTLSVETLGAEDVKKLQTGILNLGKEAGDAAPEFEQLAAEIGKLGASAETLRAFEALAAKFEETAAEQRDAAAASETLATKLNELRAATEAAEATQKQAKDAWLQGKAEVRDLATELTRLKESYRQGEISQDAYKASFNDLITRQNEAKKSLDQLAAARTEANRSASAAVAAENKVSSALESSARKIDDLARAAEKQKFALDQAGKALGDVGLVADDAAASQARLKQLVDAANSSFDEARVKLDLAKEGYKQLQTAQEAYAEEQARVARTAELWAEEEAKALRATAQEAQRVGALKEAISARIIAMRNEESAATRRAAEEQIRATNEAYAREDAEARRVAALKQAITQRLIELNREQAQKTEETARRAAAAAQQAAEEMDRAFSTLGVRSVQQVEAEIKDVEAAMVRVQTEAAQTGRSIAGAMQAGEARIKELQREVRELSGSLTASDKAASLFKNSMGQIAAGNLIADGIAAIVEKVKEMAREFVRVNIQAETMNRALTAVYKSSEVAAQQINFLRNTATSAGVSFSGLSESFVKFSAATKSSNIPIEQTNALFEGLVRASATLGLSTQRTQLALDALGQIASKGTVSMEELRQQLGDSLPGALSLTAKGLGVTDAELIKLVETGRLASRDFFPALTKGLQELQGSTDGIVNSWERFKNTLTGFAQDAGAAGAIDILRGAIKALEVGMVALLLPVLKAFEAVTLLARGLGVLAGAVVTLTNPMEKLKDLFGETTNRVTGYEDRLKVALGVMTEAEAQTAALARQKEAEAKATGQQVAATTSLGAEIDSVTKQALAYSSASSAAQIAAKANSDTNAELSSRYVALGKDIANLVEQQKVEVLVATQGIKAAKEQAEAIAQIASLRGTERDAIDASLQGNQLLINAQQQEATAREAVAASLAVELDAKQKLALQQDKTLESRRAELEAIAKKLETANAEAVASREELKNLEATRRALELKRVAYEDNSKSVKAFRADMELANAEMLRASRLYAEGRITQDQLNKSMEAAAFATGKYRDAVKDQNANLDLSIQIKSAENRIVIAGLQAKLEEARSAERIARLKGDEVAATRAVIEQKNLEAQITTLTARAKVEEVEATILAIKAKRDEEERTVGLTEEKRKEYELRLLNEKAKLIEAKAGEASVKAIEAEIIAIRNLTKAKKDSNSVPLVSSSSGGRGSNSSSGSDSLGGGLNLGRGSNLGSPSRNSTPKGSDTVPGDPYGRTYDQVNRLMQQGGPVDASYNFQVRERLNRGESFSPDEIAALRNGLQVSLSNQMLGRNSAGLTSLEGMRSDDEWVEVFRRALERAEGAAQVANNPSGFAGGSFFGNTGRRAGQQSPSPSSSGGGYTVNVNLNGSMTKINTASQSDADALARLLAGLGNAAGTSTARVGG